MDITNHHVARRKTRDEKSLIMHVTREGNLSRS